MLPNTSFYSKLFKDYGIDPHDLYDVEDWHTLGLPLIKKATYLKNPRDFVVKKPEHPVQTHFAYRDAQHEFGDAVASLLRPQEIRDFYTPKMLVFSGGTESGNPAPVILTTEQKFDTLFGNLDVIGELLLTKNSLGKTIGMNLFPYAPHLGWHSVHYALDRTCDLNLGTAAGGAIPTERLVKLANEMKPNIICGMNSYLRHRFLPLAIEQKIKLPERVIFINGAEQMLEPERSQIIALARKLGVQTPIVLDLYGASEYKEALLPECTMGSGFHHIAPLSTIIKTVTVNKTYNDVITDWDFADTGYATSWTIDGAGTQFAGYLVGDRIDSIDKTPCMHCGLNVERYSRISRIRDVEMNIKLTGTAEQKIKGTRVDLVALREQALALDGIDEVQLIVKNNKLTLYYVGAPSASKKLRTISEIRPKIVRTTLSKLRQDKVKFQPIIVQ